MTLREYRKRAGMTLDQMARELQIQRYTLQRWETGVRIPDAIGVAMIEAVHVMWARCALPSIHAARGEKATRAKGDGEQRIVRRHGGNVIAHLSGIPKYADMANSIGITGDPAPHKRSSFVTLGDTLTLD